MTETETALAAAARFGTTLVPDWLELALPAGDGPAPVVEHLSGGSHPRTTLAQTRTVFTLAHLYLATGDDRLLQAARRVKAFLSQHLRDADGGYRAAVAADGSPLPGAESRLRNSYDQSFVLLALVTLRRADPQAVAAEEIEDCWRFVEERLTEDASGALWEDDRGAAGSQVRAQNPHMHMLEALLQAHEMTGEAAWLPRAARLVALAEARFIDPATGAVREFMGPDLGPLAHSDGRRREPGHQYEWAWLLRRYAGFSGDDAPVALADRMQAFADQNGLRRDGPMAGAPFEALDDQGGVRENGHLLWPLTEMGKLYAARARDLGEDASAERARWAGEMIFGRYFARGGAPRWVNRLDGTGGVTWDAALSRLLYHVALYVTEAESAGLWAPATRPRTTRPNLEETR